MAQKPSILIISDVSAYSTADVYNGLMHGFRALQINVSGIPIFHEAEKFSFKMLFKLAMAEALVVDKFDYILFIGGHSVPEYLPKTLHNYGKRIAVYATDDPQSTNKVLSIFCEDNIDLYFTNERTLSDFLPGKSSYLPTAAPHIVQRRTALDSKYQSDIFFCGSIYPERIPIIERVCQFAKDNNLKCIIKGAFNYVPPTSIINEFGKQGNVNNNETLLYYLGTRVAVNMDRDPHWHPNGFNNGYLDIGKEPESINPRAYEIAAHLTIQLYVNPRQEAIDIFGDAIVIANDDIEEKLQLCLTMDKKKRDKMINKAFAIVAGGHTYKHRAKVLYDRIIEHSQR